MKYSFLAIDLLLGIANAHGYSSYRASLPVGQRLPRRQAAAGTTRTPQYDFKKDTEELWISGNCTNSDIKQVLIGWTEAGYLTEALSQWNPPSSSIYNSAVDLFLGNDSSTTYHDRIRGNIERGYSLHTGSNTPETTHFYIYCRTADAEAPDDCNDSFAYVWNEVGSDESNHYMVACPRYFDDSKTPQLSTALKNVRSGTNSVEDIQSFVDNRGSTMLHESFHWSVVGQPDIVDYIPPNESATVYGATDVSQSAKTNGAAGNSQVAEAYEITSGGILAMELFGLDSTPVVAEGSRRKRQAQGAPGDNVGAPPNFDAPSNPNTPGVDATILDWDPSGADDAKQPNVNAFYRISGSLAEINPDDYLPSPSNSTSKPSGSNSTVPSGSNGGQQTGNSTSGSSYGSASGKPIGSPYASDPSGYNSTRSGSGSSNTGSSGSSSSGNGLQGQYGQNGQGGRPGQTGQAGAATASAKAQGSSHSSGSSASSDSQSGQNGRPQQSGASTQGSKPSGAAGAAASSQPSSGQSGQNGRPQQSASSAQGSKPSGTAGAAGSSRPSGAGAAASSRPSGAQSVTNGNGGAVGGKPSGRASCIAQTTVTVTKPAVTVTVAPGGGAGGRPGGNASGSPASSLGQQGGSSAGGSDSSSRSTPRPSPTPKPYAAPSVRYGRVKAF